jgi:hypothetical protein
MHTDHVISAFVDNEPFDPEELGRALAEPGGRELLLDLIALRALVQDDGATAAPAAAGHGEWRRRERRKMLAAGFLAASILFAIGSALVLPGVLEQRRTERPPTPVRVITFDAAGD